MNENLYEALADCLQAIETGAEIESVLKRYPELADELRPVLEASVQARLLAAPVIPAAAIQRGRARVLQHAARMRESTRSPRRQFVLFPHLAVSLALVFLFFILGGTGLVRASGEALPGDRLYPVKRTVEDVRLLLVSSADGREELENEFEQKRLYEINQLLLEGRRQSISFVGEVMLQDDSRWVVSGIPVQIMPGCELPAEPVMLGASILLKGSTSQQGFVEAAQVELLAPGISLPTPQPTKTVEPDDGNQNENRMNQQNDNEQFEEDEREALENDNDDNRNDDIEDNGNDSSSDDGSNGNDASDDDNNNDNDNDNQNDDDNSGSGKDDNSNGDDDD